MIYWLIGIALFFVLARFCLKTFIYGKCNVLHTVEDKLAVVTGGTMGIGEASIETMIRKGFIIVFCGRSGSRAKDTCIPLFLKNLELELSGQFKGERAKSAELETWIQDIKQGKWDSEGNFSSARLHYRKCDLADIKDVEKLALFVKSLNKKVDVLLNNAGRMFFTYEGTVQGLEMTMGVNHFSHAYLTDLLFESLAPNARIINVSSAANEMSDAAALKGDIDFDKFLNYPKNGYSANGAYSISKLANILFTKALAKFSTEKQLAFKSVSLHPGVVDADYLSITKFRQLISFIGRPFFWAFFKNKEEGAQTTLHCVFEDYEKLVSGAYYADCKVSSMNSVACGRNVDVFLDKSARFFEKVTGISLKHLK